MTDTTSSSRIAGFYKLSIDERRAAVTSQSGLTSADLEALTGQAGLSLEQADHMVENVIGLHKLPLGIALNFMVNGRDILIPMAIEEPSVVAGASFMAKLARVGGGFVAHSTSPEMIGQIQILGLVDVNAARLALLEQRQQLLEDVDTIDPVLKRLGGGPRDLEVRVISESPIGPFLVLHLIYDVRDAMGANAINTAVEHLAPRVEAITGGRAHLRILSNLADRRLARARCTILLNELASGDFSAEEVRDGIIAAWAFAAADPYRAATHNKGIMNGVDAVRLATGNDWRAVEAGAHAFAARGGTYAPLSKWERDSAGNLAGYLELPMAAGIVGGSTRVHPVARMAVKLLGVGTARELAGVIASVGLAQNLAALRALATEGIQQGHMRLHARQVAIAAGASGEAADRIAEQMASEKAVRSDRAEELVKGSRK